MNHPFVVATLTACAAWLPISAAFAQATPVGPTTPPAGASTAAGAPLRSGQAPKVVVPDPEVPRYLTPGERAEWTAALQKLATAQNLMRDAEWNLSRKQPPNTSIDYGVERAHKLGAQQKAEAEALRKDANTVMNRLRAAAAAIVAAQPDKASAREYSVTIPAVKSFNEVLGPMTAELVAALRDANYSRYYLLEAVAFEGSAYAPKSELTKALSQAIMLADGDKYQFINKREAFKLAPDAGKLVLDFPTRQVVLRDNKAALIVGEAIYEPTSGYAFLGLRAIDLASMDIVASELAVLRVDTALGEALGIPAAQRPILPEPAAAPTEDASPALTVRFQDARNFVGQIQESSRPFVFRADTKPGPDTTDSRLTVLLFKHVLDTQDGLATTDADFLVRTVPLASPSARDLAAGGANAAWVLAAVTDPNVPQPLRARSLDRNTETDIGTLAIERNLDKLTFPEAVVQAPAPTSRPMASSPAEATPAAPLILPDDKKK